MWMAPLEGLGMEATMDMAPTSSQRSASGGTHGRVEVLAGTGAEVGDHVLADVPDRLEHGPLGHRAHLVEEEDLVGAGFDEALDVRDAVLRRPVGVVRVEHGVAR